MILQIPQLIMLLFKDYMHFQTHNTIDEVVQHPKKISPQSKNTFYVLFRGHLKAHLILNYTRVNTAVEKALESASLQTQELCTLEVNFRGFISTTFDRTFRSQSRMFGKSMQFLRRYLDAVCILRYKLWRLCKRLENVHHQEFRKLWSEKMYTIFSLHSSQK